MDFDVVIVGAGVVGLACAARLARDRSVLVVERHASAGRETSSRNSEVIHAGLYYPAGSLKAELCVAGRRALYARCAALGIPHRKLGKLVVASNACEVPTLEDIERRAGANGADLAGWLDRAQIARLEPRVSAVAALLSPETGIIDAHALMQSYEAELESLGGSCVFRTHVLGLEPDPAGGWRLDTISGASAPRDPALHGPEPGGGERFTVSCRCLINAAGLGAPELALRAGIDVEAAKLRQYPCKGDYFALAPRLGAITRHLVYPVPVPGGLGVHITVDLGGRYRLGPDVEYRDHYDLHIDPDKAKAFALAARRYLPEIEAADLTPDFAGIRPKLQAPGEAFRDFVIEEMGQRGAPGLIHLGGIESPGLTAAPAIAERVARIAHDLLDG